MSPFYSFVKRLAALRLRLNQVKGKLKFAIRRSNKAIALNAIFEIEALENKIQQLQIIDGVTTIVTFLHFTDWKTAKNTGFEYFSIQPFWFNESKRNRELFLHYGAVIRYITRSEKAIDIAALCCDLPVYQIQQQYSVHNGQLLSVDKPTATSLAPVQKDEFTVHNGQLVPTFEAYLESLDLHPLTPLSKDSQLTKIAEKIRENFVRESLYTKLLYDSSYRLLSFASVILKFSQFTSAEYWLKNQKQDYAIRADLNQVVSERLKSYPIALYKGGIFASDTIECWVEGLSRQRQCRPGVDFINLENNFFCQNFKYISKYEIWHYQS
jgi:hypothetical protein